MDNQGMKQNNILNGIKIPRPDKILKNVVATAVCKHIELENTINTVILSAVDRNIKGHEKIINALTDQSETAKQ